ncbi:MAG: hypothetical protein HPY50_03680 [Firmicutes bacterium]|nr:hypothetical protein [Bacillota bacterium]
MADKKIQIEVYGGTSQSCSSACFSCGSQAACGDSTPMDQQVEHFIEELQESYGNKLEVKYIDTDQSGLKAFPVINKIVKAGYPFPITVIDGKPRWAGTISIDKVRRFLYGRLLCLKENSR